MQQATRFDPAMLAQNIAVLEELRRQLRTTGSGEALLDATLVRLALAEQFAPIGEVAARIDHGETTRTAPALKKNGEPRVQVTAAEGTVSDEDDALPAPGKIWDNSGPSLSELLKQSKLEPSPDVNIAPVARDDLD